MKELMGVDMELFNDVVRTLSNIISVSLTMDEVSTRRLVMEVVWPAFDMVVIGSDVIHRHGNANKILDKYPEIMDFSDQIPELDESILSLLHADLVDWIQIGKSTNEPRYHCDITLHLSVFR
jgi:hypothetical protein